MSVDNRENSDLAVLERIANYIRKLAYEFLANVSVGDGVNLRVVRNSIESIFHAGDKSPSQASSRGLIGLVSPK